MYGMDRLIVKMGSKLDLIEEAFGPHSLRSYLAEFISTFLFVFIGVGSAISAGKLTSDASSDVTGLVAVAVAHAFALFVAVYVAANTSGGHVNPAVTFGLAVGGHISILTGTCYWVAQLLGSTMACLFLMLVTRGQAIPTHGLASEITGFGGTAIESVTTFALVYTVYTTRDPKKGPLGIMGPIAIGFVVGGCILASGPFTGGSMNPARSFGPAVITGDFKNHGVYWVGPLIGGGIAGLVYENVMALTSSQPSLAAADAA
ncbi:aquaporin TIP2-1-like [Magnolia sinica]|uniref:aquaporin TIP2-1-like n=1 Tax=Magnolia sinica TaxID=86752 RepID=UPI002659C261|nr:aquaporin TIP2-1-like [Magnolia sinica]